MHLATVVYTYAHVPIRSETVGQKEQACSMDYEIDKGGSQSNMYLFIDIVKK